MSKICSTLNTSSSSSSPSPRASTTGLRLFAHCSASCSFDFRRLGIAAAPAPEAALAWHGASQKSLRTKGQQLRRDDLSIYSSRDKIYDELYQIHQKLQSETAAQQEFAEELQKRERFLVEREELLFNHETALSKIKGVEEEILTRFQIMKEKT
ncbi:uncharacterized protein ACDL77_025501 [Rhynchocyon petersi]